MRSADDCDLRAHSAGSLSLMPEEQQPQEAIVRRFLKQVWNERRLDLIDKAIDQHCVTHQLRSGAPSTAVPRGPAATKAHIADWLRGFPDLEFTIEQIFASGD